MTLREVLDMGEGRLVAADVPEAKLNAWYLFAHCFGMDRGGFFLRSGQMADDGKVREYEVLLGRRAQRIPLEYITRETEFMGLPFYVDGRVLVPRQDTECLVEEALKSSEGKSVLDLCTGSGCIGVSLAVLGKCRSVTLADISAEALEVAVRNAEHNGAAVTVVHSDLFHNIRGRYDIIVSNPPYIPTGEIPNLMPEVRDHEPRAALDGEEDGLRFYRSIIREGGAFLKMGGVLVFEIGCDQGDAVSDMMCGAGFCRVEVKKDLAGLDRIVRGEWRREDV